MLIMQILVAALVLGAFSLAAAVIGGTLWRERAAIVRALRGNLFEPETIRPEATILHLRIRRPAEAMPLRAAA